MITFPNAKINLGLNIIEKRPDGAIPFGAGNDMINLKLTIFATLGGVRQCGGHAFLTSAHLPVIA